MYVILVFLSTFFSLTPSCLAIKCFANVLQYYTADIFLLKPKPAPQLPENLRNLTKQEQSLVTNETDCEDLINLSGHVPGIKFDTCARVLLDYSDALHSSISEKAALLFCVYEEEFRYYCLNARYNQTCMLCNLDYCNNSTDARNYFWLHSQGGAAAIQPERLLIINLFIVVLLREIHHKLSIKLSTS